MPNRVYRAVEGKAHGLVPLLLYEWVLVGGVAVLVGTVHVLAGAVAMALAIGALLAGKRAWCHRREWLRLWLRRFDERHYRILDEDVAFRPYK